MKQYVVTGLIWLTSQACWAQAKPTKAMETNLKQKIALACKLTDRDQIKRMNELHQTLFKKVARTVEHPNSYELVFNQSDDATLADLTEFIRFERQCCPWLVFHLTCQPEQGPISLEMGNSAETKQMVYLVMELDKLPLSASR
ncbi:hypothetical protein ACAW74_27915 [Fibrella sp. WM1]|uniref:hypothetical protein n=1 Tax=Fibrella musci TaxID=3242485 RepID=UPI003520959F